MILPATARFPIGQQDSADMITRARSHGREMATWLGFSYPRVILVTTIISELARNIVMYANAGQIVLVPHETDGTSGIAIVASDEGPGIANLERALLCGYSTSGSTGCGLPAISRMVDYFNVDTRPGGGTKVSAVLWLDSPQQGSRARA